MRAYLEVNGDWYVELLKERQHVPHRFLVNYGIPADARYISVWPRRDGEIKTIMIELEAPSFKPETLSNDRFRGQPVLRQPEIKFESASLFLA